jgi:hypothetical protein
LAWKELNCETHDMVKRLRSGGSPFAEILSAKVETGRATIM